MENYRMKTSISKPRALTALASLILAGLLTACQGMPTSHTAQDQNGAPVLNIQERVRRGKALFEEKCKTVAGEKIYKTVPNVEGVLLLKIRPDTKGNELSDKMWPGAAFALESRADEFITTFLGYEHSSRRRGPVLPNYRGYIGTDYQPDNASNLPGYRWVEVIDEKDGKRYRYTSSEKVVGKKDITAKGVQMAMAKNPNYDLNVYRWTLDKELAVGPEPRYAVTYEDHVNPEERVLWLASSTVKVLDRQTGEVLGEMTRYAWTGAPTPANPRPWLTAYKCPAHARGASAATRKFVDQVLIPPQEK
jgi:hypothetical protein